MIRPKLLNDVFSKNLSKEDADKERLRLYMLSKGSAEEKKYHYFGTCTQCGVSLWKNLETGNTNWSYHNRTKEEEDICNECARKNWAEKKAHYTEAANRRWEARRK